MNKEDIRLGMRIRATQPYYDYVAAGDEFVVTAVDKQRGTFSISCPASPDNWSAWRFESVDPTGIADVACAFLDEVAALVRTKNAAYGNSAADPVRIFSRAASDEQLLVRIDDKLSRVARGSLDGAGEDVLVDLVGYLALLAAKRRGAK